MNIQLNFEEALDFMDERLKYYEMIGQPSDWETKTNLGTTTVWIKKIGDDYFDTLVEEEQRKGYRVTTPMYLEELKLLFNTRKKYKFTCGESYSGR